MGLGEKMDTEYWTDVSFIGSAYDMEISSKGEYRHRRALPTRNHRYRAFGSGDDDYFSEARGEWIDGMAPDFNRDAK